MHDIPEQAKERKRRGILCAIDQSRILTSIRQFLPVMLVIMIGCVISLSAFFITRHWELREELASLEVLAKDHAKALEQGFALYIEELYAVRRLFESRADVSRDEYNAFVAPGLQRKPGIMVLNWLPRVRHEERAAFEQILRNEGHANSTIVEFDDDRKMVPAARRD